MHLIQGEDDEEIVIIDKGRGVNLIYRGHAHKRDKAIGDKQHWACVNRGCHGRVHTTDYATAVLFWRPHDCLVNETALSHHHVKSELKRLAKENPTVPLKRIYDEFIAEHFANQDMCPPPFESCSTQMHRARRTVHPAQPRSAEEVHLEGVWTEEGGGSDTRLLLHQSNEMLLFCGDEHMRCLSSCQTLLMDGTFKSAPSIYTQVSIRSYNIMMHIIVYAYYGVF